MQFKIGNGIDVHQLKENIPFIIGGIKIESKVGIDGHSDGDILLHVIVDALLGALAIGDIGTFYPSNSKWENCNSKIFLIDTLEKLKKENFYISNIDTTIILQKPKIIKFIPQIKQNLEQLMNLKNNQISVKATTTDYLGFIGKSEGIAAMATVLICKDSK
tara:strand:- start:496 stop:978 length:483 start_codon:yes stop_codon:yes gene_type:complete